MIKMVSNGSDKNWFARNSNIYRLGLTLSFGVIWLIDAVLKWMPSFIDGFSGYLQSAMTGQPNWIMGWYNFWINATAYNPAAFAYMVAVIETLLAVAIIFGIARKTAYLGGLLFTLFIWSVPDGFGAFWMTGSTDVGASIIYVILFLALLLVDGILGPSRYSIDHLIEKKHKAWARLAEVNPQF